MDDNFDWFLTGVIWAQSAMLFWCGWHLYSSSRYIARLSSQLHVASHVIEQQRRLLTMRSIPFATSDLQPADIDEMSPEMRACMREALSDLLQQLKQKEH